MQNSRFSWRSDEMSRAGSLFRSVTSNRSSSRNNEGHRRAVSQGQAAMLEPDPSAPRNLTAGTSSTQDLRNIRRFEARSTIDEDHYLFSRARMQIPVPRPIPGVDLRMVDYVAPLDENLTCPICRCPFIDPVILNECDHCFCRDCIRQTWTTSSSPYSPHGPRGDCPSCRTPAKLGPRSATTKILVNILDDLLVKCPNTSEGCSTVVKRGEVQDHVTIYCGFAKVECPDESCDSPVRRKDILKGCLHVGASCLACREEVQTSTLEQHWADTCPDRVFPCGLCDASISYKDLVEHNQRLCPIVSIPCSGAALGCLLVGKKEDMESHARECVLAKLAPVMDGQRQRMDEQEAAQKEMNRKLEIFERGFSSIQSIISPQHDAFNAGTTDNMPIDHFSMDRVDADAMADDSLSVISEFPLYSDSTANRLTRTQSVPSQSHGHNFSIDMPFSNSPLSNAPYTSPFHHLLSMHEALREEVTRTSTALADLDGRHSVLILNENIRMRDEVAFVGAQVAALQRQVTWLTSDRLQRLQHQQHQHFANFSTPQPQLNRSTSAGDVAPSSSGSVGQSVERAVNAVNSAVRDAVRIVNVHTGSRTAEENGGPSASSTAPVSSLAGPRMRRGNSDEGRPTKL